MMVRKTWHFKDPKLDRQIDEMLRVITAISRQGTVMSLNMAEYAYLPGRPGGQRIHGGISSGENLMLDPTIHNEKGRVEAIKELAIVSALSGKAFGLRYNDALDTLDIVFTV